MEINLVTYILTVKFRKTENNKGFMMKLPVHFFLKADSKVSCKAVGKVNFLIETVKVKTVNFLIVFSAVTRFRFAHGSLER